MSDRVPYIDPLESLPHAQADELPLLTTFHDVQEIFTAKTFGQAGHDDSSDFIGGTLVTINGAEHKERLRIVRPLFTREALVAYETAALIPAVERTLSSLEPEADGWIHADLVQLGRRMLTQIAAAIIGLDDVQSPERTDRLAQFSERLAAASRLKFALGDLDALRKEYLVDKTGFIGEFVDPSRRRREALIADVRAGKASEDELQADLLTTLLLHENDEWDDDQINREVILYLVGSTLTTAMTVPHAVYHIDTWVNEHPEDREKLADHEFLRQATYESMRLHASSPLQIRRALEPTELSSGHYEAGTDIAVSAAAANRDDSMYGEDPDYYNPHRTVNDPHFKLYGHTFATGEHRCIGEHLAAGMRASKGQDNATRGMVLSILTALYDRGVRLDPENPPQKDVATTADFYTTCHVLFRPSATE
jgi:cytochrome P450